MLKFRTDFHEYNNIVGVLEVSQGAPDGAKTMSAGHWSTVLRIKSSIAKLNRKGPATAPCLTPVTTSNGVVHPAGVQTAAVVH
ncbi:hypothetical protein RB195_009447 [Necator americanus]|uniref:Uncharacterized protein n=1 Tax=Necator americanus TaxID=51031 RepID=A0ABR1CTB5_NECAM